MVMLGNFLELPASKFYACIDSSNIQPMEQNPKIVSPLRDCRVSGLPSTDTIMQIVAERLHRVELMWSLGDQDQYFDEFRVYNCEPYGVMIQLLSKSLTRNRGVHIVIPTLDLFLHMDERLNEALPKLMQQAR